MGFFKDVLDLGVFFFLVGEAHPLEFSDLFGELDVVGVLLVGALEVFLDFIDLEVDQFGNGVFFVLFYVLLDGVA